MKHKIGKIVENILNKKITTYVICSECGAKKERIFKWYSCPACNSNNISHEELKHMKELVLTAKFLELFQWIKGDERIL